MQFRVALIAYGIFLAYLVYTANCGIFPEILSFYRSIPYGDTIGHFCLMGTFAFLAVWATQARSITIAGLRVSVGAAMVLLIVVTEEISQVFITRRSFSVLDLAADLFGITLLGWIAHRIIRGLRYRQNKPHHDNP